MARRPQMNLQVKRVWFLHSGSVQDLIDAFRKYSKCPGQMSGIYKKTGDLEPQNEWHKANPRISVLSATVSVRQPKPMTRCHCPFSDKLQLPSFSLSLSPRGQSLCLFLTLKVWKINDNAYLLKGKVVISNSTS